MTDMPAAAGSGRAPGRAEPGLIHRHDLMAALNRAAQKRVTIISAPAGTGKTSLLRAWADQPGQDCRVAFMTVRPGQHDMQLFWLAVLGAVRAAAGTGEGDAQLPPATPGSSGSAMMDKVLSELEESGDRFVLVIDDLHELSSPEAAGQLTALLTRLPAGVRAIVATRRDLPLRLHKLRLAGDLAEIRAAQLRFTQHETRQLLAAAGIALPEHVAAMLHQRTEGWAAGLRLAVLSLAGHPDPERFVAEFSGSDRTVAEYLMAEMLERQPPEVQGLLLRTSVLDRVNGELADLLTGATGSERILLELEDANAFVVSLDPGRTWFRYHRMFGGLLRLELRRTMPADIAGLHQLAARWLAEHGQAADAIGHLQAAGDWDEAARMLTDHALSLTLDGQAGTVAALLRSFPARTGEDSPDLTLVRAIADQYQLRLDQTDAHLREVRAYAAATPPGRRRRLQMAIASVDLLSARLRGDFDSIFEQAGALLCPGDGQTSADVALSSDLKAVALLNLGVTEAWSLRLADSERHLVAGAALACRIGRPYLEVACLAHLGFAVHEPLLRHGPAALRGSHSGGGAARLGRRGGDRPGAGGARQRADLDGPVRPRRTLAGPRQARHPGRRRARHPAAGVPYLRDPPGGARPLPPGAGGVRRRPADAGAHGRRARADYPRQCVDDRHPGPARDGRAGAGCSGRPRRPAGQRRRDPQRGRGDPAGRAGPRRRPPRTPRSSSTATSRFFPTSPRSRRTCWTRSPAATSVMSAPPERQPSRR